MKNHLRTRLLIGTIWIGGCGETPESAQRIHFTEEISAPYRGEETRVASGITESIENILAIYKTEDTREYQDSLIMTEQYDLGKGVIAFSKDAIKVVENQGLILENKNERYGSINCPTRKSIAVVSYTISKGFIEKVPVLYMTQIFIEGNHSIYVISHSTEKFSEQQEIQKMFKNITCNFTS